MNEALIRINNIPIYGFGLLAVLAFLWGSFVYYKKAMEANLEDKVVLDSVVLCAFWGFIVGRVIFVFLHLSVYWSHFSRIFLLSNYPGIDRWGVLLGIALGLWLCLRKSKVKFLDWFDLVCLGITSGTAVFFAGLSILAFMWQYLVLAVLFLVAFIYFWGAEETYRVLDWYRNKKTSAKSGYITGLSLSAWGILLVTELLLDRSFSWPYGLWSVILFVGGLVLVYIRSGRTVKDDIKIVFKHGKK
jgi:hypothetical protein